MTSRVLISRGRPAFPASLRSKTVACCKEIVARIWANRSPGATRSSSIPKPGRMPRSISCWIGGDPEPTRHLARGRERHRRSRRRDGVEVRVVELRAMHERDVLTQQLPLEERGDRATSGALRAAVDVDPQAQLPGERPLLGQPIEIGRARTGPLRTRSSSAARRRRSVGPRAASSRPRRRVPRATGTWTNTDRSPASACAWSAASARASSARRCDQSTMVVIPASVAPSKPIKVAA